MTEDDTHDRVVPGSDEAIDSANVRGHGFDDTFDFDEFLDAYAMTGSQVTQLVEAINIAKETQGANATVYLTFASNIVSSDLREVIAYLVCEGFVDVPITTSGSLTEDVIKTAKPFKMGSWDVDEGELRECGINCLGNIYVPSDRYVWPEQYLCDFLEDFFAEEKVRTSTTFARRLGVTLDDEYSVLKQAADNDVPVYCLTLIDAEVGSFLYYYRQGYDKEVGIEILDDYDSLIQDGLFADETDLIAVGDSVPKHYAIMTSFFRGGTDYVAYTSTGTEGDGSLSGVPPNETVSWGKVKDHDTNYMQVEAEATLVFPPLVAGVFRSQRSYAPRRAIFILASKWLLAQHE